MFSFSAQSPKNSQFIRCHPLLQSHDVTHGGREGGLTGGTPSREATRRNNLWRRSRCSRSRGGKELETLRKNGLFDGGIRLREEFCSCSDATAGNNFSHHVARRQHVPAKTHNHEGLISLRLFFKVSTICTKAKFCTTVYNLLLNMSTNLL